MSHKGCLREGERGEENSFMSVLFMSVPLPGGVCSCRGGGGYALVAHWVEPSGPFSITEQEGKAGGGLAPSVLATRSGSGSAARRSGPL